EGKRPASITVNLLVDGDNIQTVEIKPDEQGNWSYEFTELPKYQDDGVTEIVYTVTENAVEGYTTTIDGFKITNTFNEKPPTGDTLGLNMWIGMLAAAIAAVSVILIAWRKKCVR
ncbi:MAG: Cna B-type domain-containing protein, partial [Firmicutes bacterium]|nr:Cna B-type domain-containing protein [Bacillota bacterium]